MAVCQWEPVNHLFYEPQWEFFFQFNTRADGWSPSSVVFIEFVGILWWYLKIQSFISVYALTCYTLLFEGLPDWINPPDK